MANEQTIINVAGVNKSFGKLRAVADLRFSVTAGHCFGLLGPNGAGKTTMMKMIYGKALRDTGGVIDVFGFDPAREALDIKARSGVVPQEDNLDEELDVYSNLIVYSKLYNLSRAQADERIEELLTFMELSDRRKANIRELSGGMKRRLIIVRALLNRPRLLILDEPTTGLDPQVRHIIWDKLRQLKRGGLTILLTTHYMEEAWQLCDRLLIMHQGKSILEGSPRGLTAEHIEACVMEVLSTDGADGLAADLPDGVRMERTSGRILLYAGNQDLLRPLIERLNGAEYHLRPSNLEDVFLKATGRALNDAQ